MPTPISPMLPPSASSANSAPKANASEQQFQRTLVRQIEQRQTLDHTRSQAQASTQAKAKADAKADTDAKTRADANAPQAEPPASADTARDAREVTPPSADKADVKSADPATQPLSDMLALVASLQQTGASTPATAIPATPTATEGAPVKRASARSTTALPDAEMGQATSKTHSATQNKAATSLLDAAPKAAPLDLKLAAAATPEVALATLKSVVPDAPLPGAVNLVAPPAQAALHIVQAASAVPTDKLNGQVGSAAWDQQLGQKVVWMAAGGAQSATLTLNPPDLGPLQVVLNVSNDLATVSFTSAQPEVRQALEAAMPKLRDMMGEAGLNLGNASVSAGTSHQEHASAQQERMRHGGGARPGNNASNASGQVMLATPAARGSARQGIVDTFA